MVRLFALLAGTVAGWFAFRFLRRRRAARTPAEADPASELRDQLSTARETEASVEVRDDAAGVESAAGASDVEEPDAASGGDPGEDAPTNDIPSLEDERQRVHGRAREAAERMRPDDQSD